MISPTNQVSTNILKPKTSEMNKDSPSQQNNNIAVSQIKVLDDESFEMLSEICENNLNVYHKNLDRSSEIGKKTQTKNEEIKIEELSKLDPTLQSEYEPNLKINDISLDSQDYIIKQIFQAPIHSMETSKEFILDDISLENKSSVKNERTNEHNSNEILKRSEIQVLQSKREEALNKPMYFNVLIVGASSLGKTTFIDVFLNNKFEKINKIRPPTNDIFETTAKIKYENFHFYLKLIDTPGFTHSTNMKIYYKNLKKNIIERFSKFKKTQKKREKKEYLQSQKEKTVKEAIDERIHLCLYFASAPRINEHDLFLMKKLQKYCNIIPIIAKGDCYTPDEIKEIKLEFNKATKDYGVEFFDCTNSIDSPEKLKLLKEGPFGPCPPFLIITSLEKIELEPNKFAYCRKYNWGTCNIENPLHCDFSLMYKLLIGYFSLELINLTDFYYKSYLNQKQETKRKLRENEQKYKIGFGIMTFILGAIYFKKSMI